MNEKGESDQMQPNIYTPNSTTETVSKFMLLDGYTEPDGQTVVRLSIDLTVKSDFFPEVSEDGSKDNREIELQLNTFVEAYDKDQLCSLKKTKGSWKFPKTKRHIKVMPILVEESKIHDRTKDLEIRVDLRISSFKPIYTN